MGSKTFDGVRFAAFTYDHLPPHVHGYYAEVRVIVQLVDGTARLSFRRDAILPRSGKRSDVNHVLRTATKYQAELMELWRVARG